MAQKAIVSAMANEIHYLKELTDFYMENNVALKGAIEFQDHRRRRFGAHHPYHQGSKNFSQLYS